MKTTSSTNACQLTMSKQVSYKWLLGLVMVTVLTLGWRFPILGFIVPVAMIAGISGGVFRGRWVCGNMCPRGSFLDSWFSLVASNKPMPAVLQNSRLRWTVVVVLMSFMVYRLAQHPEQWQHWGRVFWQMCLLTSLTAVALGLRYSARSWCSVCPVGTMAGSLGGAKYQLQVAASCKDCSLCEQACPMQLKIAVYRHGGVQQEQDCIKCSACQRACPRGDVLSWPTRKAA